MMNNYGNSTTKKAVTMKNNLICLFANFDPNVDVIIIIIIDVISISFIQSLPKVC